jgi:two-component system alkaline phosphatase synthesis response regulator PhoP
MRRKILLVDDSRTSLFVEHMILKKEPYDIVTACDGVEAVSTARKERPDLILMDVVMPKMDGFQALRKIRGEKGIKDTPVIMVTTRGEGPNMEEGFSSGCSDYVTKPVDAVELLSKVRSCLPS